MQLIRDVFTSTRSIDRRIEKVIDYAATEESRLEQEIAEYEVTPSVERGLRRFLEAFDEGARLGSVTEIGVWVSGFYGSGKSSLTKYLGLALDSGCTIRGVPFVDRLADRIPDTSLRALLKTASRRHKTAVFMLDLGTDQLAESASDSVANVLYWNILKQLGFSKERKVADLEIRLEGDKKLEAFKASYATRFPDKEPWDIVHNDPVLAVLRASIVVPEFYPDDYKHAADFRQLEYQPIEDVKALAQRVVDLIRRRRGCESIVFFVDEVGQYVAPRKELILNLDGLARAFKEIGAGRVWFVATAQQTLTEISDKASLNSADLFKLKDRFPITIELEPTDISEITAHRLLTKNPEGEAALKKQFAAAGALLDLHAHLVGWPGGKVALDADTFARFYPFLPTRFELVLDLIRALARRTGGTGLRSAIRLVQDLLVDASHTLAPGSTKLADRPFGRLATVEDIYDTLRQDLHKEHPQAVEGVDRIAKHPTFKDDALALRVAKAVAVLQPLEQRPRSAENIAALLYSELGANGAAEGVRASLHRLVDAQEFGLVELRADSGAPGGTGFLFLSNEVQPLQKKRDQYHPPQSEQNAVRLEVLRRIFDPVPETRLENVKLVQAGVRLGRGVVAGESSDVLFRLEELDAGTVEARLLTLEVESQAREEHANVVFWLFGSPEEAQDKILDVCRSGFIQIEGARSRDREKAIGSDVSRYLRSEEGRAERAKDGIRGSYQDALLKGWFVFRGRKRPVAELDKTVLAGATSFLGDAAKKVFNLFDLVKKNVAGDVAARFLEVTRPEQMPTERDPLGLMQIKGSRTSVNTGHPALAEVLRTFRASIVSAGSGRVQGSTLLERFHAAPYGWSKDTTRYLFAALLMAGEIELHGGDGILRTPGPKAIEAFRNTQSFGRVGVAVRGQPVPMEALDRASRRLEEMFAVEVLPLEDQVARVVRTHFPTVLERAGALPDRLRLLKLPGEARARGFLEACADLLKEDAGGAASLLGGTDTTLPADLKWAAGVTKALDAGGEAEITRARGLVERVHGLAELFPEAEPLARHLSLGTIAEVLGSESFADRLADLREAHRDLEASARAVALEASARLEEQLESVRVALEARPSWIAIGVDDRKALTDEISRARAAESPDDVVVALSRVLTKRLASRGLDEVLGRKADELARPEPEVMLTYGRSTSVSVASGGGMTLTAPGHTVSATPLIESVAMSALLPAAPLVTAEDVERWIERLRSTLLERVEAGPIRLTGDG